MCWWCCSRYVTWAFIERRWLLSRKYSLEKHLNMHLWQWWQTVFSNIPYFLLPKRANLTLCWAHTSMNKDCISQPSYARYGHINRNFTWHILGVPLSFLAPFFHPTVWNMNVTAGALAAILVTWGMVEQCLLGLWSHLTSPGLPITEFFCMKENKRLSYLRHYYYGFRSYSVLKNPNWYIHLLPWRQKLCNIVIVLVTLN